MTETLDWLLSLPKEEADQMRDILTKMSRREEKEAKEDRAKKPGAGLTPPAPEL